MFERKGVLFIPSTSRRSNLEQAETIVYSKLVPLSHSSSSIIQNNRYIICMRPFCTYQFFWCASTWLYLFILITCIFCNRCVSILQSNNTFILIPCLCIGTNFTNGIFFIALRDMNVWTFPFRRKPFSFVYRKRNQTLLYVIGVISTHFHLVINNWYIYEIGYVAKRMWPLLKLLSMYRVRVSYAANLRPI